MLSSIKAMGTQQKSSEQPEKEVRYCRACGKELTSWKSPYCSDQCYESGPSENTPKLAKKPVSSKPSEKKIKPCPSCGGPIKYWRNKLCDACLAARSEAEPEEAKQSVSTDTKPNGRVSKRGVLNEGAPSKGTDERLAAILDDLAQGLTEEEAAAGNGVAAETFSRWKNLPEFSDLRAKAKYHQIKRLLHLQETAEAMDWKRWQWRLQVTARDSFGDPAKIGVQVNTQFNNGNRGISQEELEETRKRLDECDYRQAQWKAGNATDAELRQCMVEERDRAQRVIDHIDAGNTSDQETQRQLYWNFHEKSHDRQSPIKEAIGHVTDSNSHAPLAIEDVPEPVRAAPGISMRASDIDPSSGQRKRFDSGSDSQESQTPPEPHVRQRDRKQLAGPLSERQRWEAQEKARRGGEGKSPF